MARKAVNTDELATLKAEVAELKETVAKAYNLGRAHEDRRLSESRRRPFDYDKACAEVRALGVELNRYGQEAKAREVE